MRLLLATVCFGSKCARRATQSTVSNFCDAAKFGGINREIRIPLMNNVPRLRTRLARHVGHLGLLFHVGHVGQLRQAPVPLAVFALVLFHVQGIRCAAQRAQCDTSLFGIGLDCFGLDVASTQ